MSEPFLPNAFHAKNRKIKHFTWPSIICKFEILLKGNDDIIGKEWFSVGSGFEVKKMHRTKEQLIISYIIMKWSKLFHHSLYRCTYACTFGQKQYFLVFFLSSCICGWADRAKERTKCGVRKYETVFELAPCCCWQKWSAGGRNVTKLCIPSTINSWVLFWHSNWGWLIK